MRPCMLIHIRVTAFENVRIESISKTNMPVDANKCTETNISSICQIMTNYMKKEYKMD